MKDLGQKISLVLLLTLLPLLNSFAQMPAAKGIGTINGVVQDSISEKPLEFATVSIYQGEALKAGGMTDEKGKFKVEDLPFGNYKVKVDFMGYDAKIIADVKLTDKKITQNLGKIGLSNAAALVDAAEVVADRAAFQLALDKKVFDVEKAGLSQSENATEVLRQTPTVEVDPDGNVKIRGSAVQVYINGKPTGLTGESQADILEQLPANNIKSIELITAPSARFDPEGESGIINIVMKRNFLEGFTGNVTGSVGTWFNKYRADLGLNYRNRWVNVFSSFGYNYNDRWSRGSVYRETTQADSSFTIDQTSGGNRFGYRLSGRIGAEFTLNKRNSLTLSANFGGGSRNRRDSINYNFLDENDQLSNFDERNSYENGMRQNNSYSLTYRLEFPKAQWPFKKKEEEGKKPKRGGYGGGGFGERHELQIDLQFSQNTRFSQDSFHQQSYLPSSAAVGPAAIQRTITNDYRPDGMIRIDYTRPYGKDFKFEMGYKGTLRSNRKDFFSETFNPNDNSFEEDTNLNNDFQYTEQIHAAYVTIGQKIKKFSYKLGFRFEQTFTDAELFTTNEVFKNDYPGFFPTLNMSYSFNPLNQLQFSFNRRINRPGAWATNPFPSFSDPLNLRYGNPFLLPAFSNAVELGYANYSKAGSFVASAFYRYNTGLFERIRSVREDGVSETTFQNLNTNTNYGIELTGRYKIFKWWTLTASFSGFQQIQDATNINDDYIATTITGNASLNMMFTLPKNFNINLNFWSSLPEKEAQGTNRGYQHSGINISKGFANNKGTIALNARNPILGGRWISYSFGDNFEADSAYFWEAPIVYLRVSYRFGKMNARDRMRRGGYGGGFGDGDEGGMMD
jgi:iron complex outermembrane receptor protein